jgi:hypothetical protein
MPRLTLDSATTKITKDNVITANELASVANVDEAKADPTQVVAKLDQYESAMTPTAKDRTTRSSPRSRRRRMPAASSTCSLEKSR